MALPVLALAGVRKSFNGVQALTDGAIELHAGRVTALIGENGAGKSTLVKILTGVHPLDGGEIRLDGRPVRIDSPAQAERLGISVIHQESVVFDDLTVAENVFVTARPRRRGLIDWAEMRRRTAKLLAELESNLDPGTLLRDLSVGQKHLVQIARALSHDARIIVMDEPTAALSHHEAEDLLAIVRRLRDAGRAILFISHKFEEIFAIADRYAVFRDGAAVGSGELKGTTLDQLLALMVGRPVSQLYPERHATLGAEILRVEELSYAEEFADVSLVLRRGEILGIYGLVGAGRSELMQALFGMAYPSAGRVVLDGNEVAFANPQAAMRAGLAYVPEDRRSQGAILSQSIRDNVLLPSLSKYSHLGFVRPAEQQSVAEIWAKRLMIKCSGTAQPVAELSGGNQQKVVLAKWLLTGPRVLILDEPTKGIDIGSKAAVHELMAELASQGLAIILVSSELPEVLGLSDRIVVMRRGRVRAQFERSEASAEDILRAATDS